jgi:general secretion pathway protein L
MTDATATFPAKGPLSSAQKSGATSRLPRPLGQFLRWWVRELRDAASPLIEKYWVDHANKLTVALDETGALPPNVKLNGKDVRLLLSSISVLQKTVSYPAAIEENLQEVIANDIDRQTPFTATQVYIASRIARRFEGADGVARVEVDITVALKKMVDAATDRVREGGGRVVSLGIAEDTFHIELLPESARPARRLSALQRVNIGLLALLCLLITVAIVVPIFMKRSDVKLLAPMVDKAKFEAESTRKIEAEFQRLQREYQVAANKKYASYQVIDILEDVTRISPDTTWLQVFELKTAPLAAKNSANAGKPPIREIKLEGEAASAAKMIELLEQSKFLQNTTQRAQTTRGAQPNTEFFRLSTEVKPRPAPGLVDLLALPEKPAVVAAPVPATPNPIATVSPTPSATPMPDKNAKGNVGKEVTKNGAVILPLPAAPAPSPVPAPAPISPPANLTQPPPMPAPQTPPAPPTKSMVKP